MDDVRGEIAEANEPCKIGWADALPLGERRIRYTVAADKSGVELACLEQQLHQPSIGFCCRKWVSGVYPHLNLPPGSAQRNRHGKDLGVVVDRARFSCKVEERSKPCRADMDVDLIVPDVDPLYQRSKKGTLTCFRQLGPDLVDLSGSRDQPVPKELVQPIADIEAVRDILG